jgi:hypothetical protein
MEADVLAKQIDGWLKALQRTPGEGTKRRLLKQISEAQSILNASNPEAYLGAGSLIWVTLRDARTLGGGVLTELSASQRIAAALGEGKFLDEALLILSHEGGPAEIVQALRDLGKHGDRIRQVLDVGTLPPFKALRRTHVGEQLDRSAAKLRLLDADARSGVLLRRLSSKAEIEREVAEVRSLLEDLSKEANFAISTLTSHRAVASASAEELARIQRATQYLIAVTRTADRLSGRMAAWAEVVHGVVGGATGGMGPSAADGRRPPRAVAGRAAFGLPDGPRRP